MNDKQLCPNRDFLCRFVSGELDEAGVSWVDQHLASCEACAATVHALASGSTFSVSSAGEGSHPDAPRSGGRPDEPEGYPLDEIPPVSQYPNRSSGARFRPDVATRF
ncbi:MAG: hypothetical protein GXP27_04030 [Planctomycetes bacterium]|nr:hypothetical protein [Planctomycetota bacterium]